MNDNLINDAIFEHFGPRHLCWNPRECKCCRAWLEYDTLKLVVDAAKSAVIAFGSDSEGDAIAHLGKVLADMQ